MNQTSRPSPPLPRWLVVSGSVAIIYHLIAITIPVLNAPSGPWATQVGRAAGEAPPFARNSASLASAHADYLRVVHSYRFMNNRPAEMPGVKFEVRLRDAQQKPLATLPFPDPQANPWVRHRQAILASALAPDVPVEQQGGELLPAPGAAPPQAAIWAIPADAFPDTPKSAPPPGDAKTDLRLRSVPQHLVPRNRAVMRPSEWAVLLAKSYGRYVCRTHGAASAEVVRVTREPIPPDVMFQQQTPQAAFKASFASFGEVSP